MKKVHHMDSPKILLQYSYSMHLSMHNRNNSFFVVHHLPTRAPPPPLNLHDYLFSLNMVVISPETEIRGYFFVVVAREVLPTFGDYF